MIMITGTPTIIITDQESRSLSLDPGYPPAHAAVAAKLAFHSLDDHAAGDLPDAAVIVGAIPEPPQVARRAAQVSPNDRMRPAIRPDPDRVGRTEDADHRGIHGHRDVH